MTTMSTTLSAFRGRHDAPTRRKSTTIALALALVAVLLPIAIEVSESGAAGPPAGCNLFDAFEPTFVGNTRVTYSAKEPVGASTEENSPRSIYVSDLDGTDRAEISSVSAGTDPTNNRDPVASPNGAQIAWDGIPGSGRSILVADANGGARVDVSSVAPATAGSNRHPRWSADGTKITWYNEEPTTGGIYVANANGSAKTEISGAGLDPAANQRPVLSKDGTKVAWSGVNATTLRREIYVANANGSGRITISDKAGLLSDNNYPDFNQDGTRIVWSGNDGSGRQIFAADSATGLNRITLSTVSGGSDPSDNITPRFSPDGTRVVWVGRESTFGFSNVWVANANGTSRVDITNTPANDPSGNQDPVWSPDGTKITWSGIAKNGNQIWVADANGGNRTEVSVVDDPAFCDNTAPEITLNAPANGVMYALNQSVTASYSCNDPESGIASCVGTLANGAALDTSVRRANVAFTVTATNNFGTVKVLTHNYSVDAPPPSTTTTTTTTMLPAGQPSCPNDPTPFTDVRPGSFAASDIRCIYGLGITTGTTPTTYSPNDNVTREQMASFLARLWRSAGGGCPTAATPFTDISPTSFAAADIRCIYGLGFTTGTTKTTYSPKDTVTREQMASFLARVWRGAGGTCTTTPAPFTDVSPTSFARFDIDCIFGLGTTTGTAPTTYSPNENVTREQMAAFLGRLYRKMDELT